VLVGGIAVSTSVAITTAVAATTTTTTAGAAEATRKAVAATTAAQFDNCYKGKKLYLCDSSAFLLVFFASISHCYAVQPK
jgi:hypothetical protein